MLRAVEQIATVLVGFIPRMDVSLVQLRLVDRLPIFHGINSRRHPDQKHH
ncbi:MAG TPA: hypothetical protein VJT77_00380 [Burkholderiales bacterium]|nr:hypothetical protein [Burkholderiales bacterium]